MTVIKNGHLVLPDRVTTGALTVREGRIKSLTEEAGAGGEVVDVRGGFIAPGFIDLHVHGAVGHDTMEGSRDAFEAITRFHLSGGTTSIALTTLTAPEPAILHVLDAARACHNQSLGGSRIIGVHIEGPFISKEKAGAQDPNQIRPPRREEWQKYIAFGKVVTEMTLAPESEGALELIAALRAIGAIASGGHTDATEKHLEPAEEAGMNHATHIFNAMSTITKRGPYRLAGMLEYALARPTIRCELIADGVHVPKYLMRMLLNAKGAEGVCIITDATAGAGLPAGTTFSLAGNVQAKVTHEVAVLANETGLAGSTLTMIKGVQKVVELGGATLSEAVKMASLNPATQLNREKEFGSLEPGKRADLIWFDEAFQVRGAWLDGERLL